MSDDALTQRWIKQVGANSPWLMIGMALVTILASLLAATGYVKARNAQERITALEVQRRATDTSRVATCYPTARSRDVVVGGLSGLALSMGVTIDSLRHTLEQNQNETLAPVYRENLAKLIPAKTKLEKTILLYADAAPTIESCDELAARLGINPAPFRKAPRSGSPKAGQS